MAGSLIAIHVEGHDGVGPVGALLSACNEVAEVGSCIAHDDARTSEASIEVEVVWDASSRVATISLTTHGQARLSRTLLFEQSDDPRERWRTVGMAIGVAAEALGSDEKAPDAKPSAAGTPNVSPTPETDTSAKDQAAKRAVPWEAARWSVDAAAVTGPSLEKGPWRLGGSVRGWYRPTPVPLLVTSNASYSRQFASHEGVGLDFIGIGIGAALAMSPLSRLEIRVRVEPLLEFIAARTSGGPDASASGLDFGISGGADVALGVTPAFFVIAGADIATTTQDTLVRLDGSPVGRVPAVTSTGLAGVRVSFVDE